MAKICKMKLTKILEQNTSKIGVGALFYSTNTKRFLLLKRASFCDEPYTWGIVSGSVENNENNVQALQREIFEETGLSEKFKIIQPSFLIFRKSNFTFYNYLVLTNNEFIPSMTDFENTQFVWTDKIENINNLHFGVKYILKNYKKLNNILS